LHVLYEKGKSLSLSLFALIEFKRDLLLSPSSVEFEMALRPILPNVVYPLKPLPYIVSNLLALIYYFDNSLFFWVNFPPVSELLDAKLEQKCEGSG